MRKILCCAVMALALSGAGCSTINHIMKSDVPESIVTAQETAEQVVLGFEGAFQVTPSIVNALLKNGNITPHQYNTEILPAYNEGLASLNVLIGALKTAETARQDPNTVENYTKALAKFLADKGTVDSILTAFGKGATP